LCLRTCGIDGPAFDVGEVSDLFTTVDWKKGPVARVARVSLNLLVPLSYGAIAAPGGLEPPTDA
jgi:hypothetical protein